MVKPSAQPLLLRNFDVDIQNDSLKKESQGNIEVWYNVWYSGSLYKIPMKTDKTCRYLWYRGVYLSRALPGTEGEIICADAEDESSTDWHQRQAVLRTVRGTVVYLGFSAKGAPVWNVLHPSTHVNCKRYISEGSL